MDKMMIPAIGVVMQVGGLANELHDLILKVRRHLVDPASRLAPSEIEQIEQRIAELGGRHGHLGWRKPTEGTATASSPAAP